MQLVQSLGEINANIQTLDRYLDEKQEPEYSYASGLVKRGTCFIATKSDQGYKFYPCKFIGYKENTMNIHQSKVSQRDGRDTERAISAILHQDLSPDPELEAAYREYCKRLGFTANEKGTFGKQRKYWRLI